jgi:CRISPR-associated protein Cas2
MVYLIAYDIADPRRLQRVAHFMERRALRCQKSVFLFHGDGVAVAVLLDQVSPLLDAACDVVQAWQLAGGPPPLGLVRGSPLSVYPAGVVLGREQTLFVQSRAPRLPETRG